MLKSCCSCYWYVVKKGGNQLKDPSHGFRIVTGRSLGSVAVFIQKVEQISCGQEALKAWKVPITLLSVIGVREPKKLYFAVKSSA